MSFLTSFLYLDLFITICIVWRILYLHVARKFGYWERKGLPYIKPKAFFGNFRTVFFAKESLGSLLQKYYNKMKEPMFGLWMTSEPVLVVNDTKIIKHILQTDFNYFCDRFSTVENKKLDPILENTLPHLTSSDWQKSRAILSEFFHKDNQILLELMDESCENMVLYIDQLLGEKLEVNVNDLSEKLCCDMVASVVFGTNENSFVDNNSILLMTTNKMFKNSLKTHIKNTLFLFMPSLAKLFKVKQFNKKTYETLKEISKSVMDERIRLPDSKRGDFLDFLKEHYQNCGEDVICANVVMFLTEALQNTSNTLAFLLYELCLHEEIQEKLRAEIKFITKKYNDVNFEAVESMAFLQNCIYETLRKYPSIPYLERTCTESYQVPDTKVTVDEGTKVFVSVLGLHYDRKYFIDPLKFDPERFTKIKNLPEMAFLPFGEGKRNCIGRNFAIQAIKLAVVHLILNYKFVRSPKTISSVKFEKRSMVLKPSKGLNIEFKRLI